MSKSPKRACVVKVLGYGGAAFIALAACAENLEKYLFSTAAAWIIGGTVLAMLWAFETFCAEGSDEDE